MQMESESINNILVITPREKRIDASSATAFKGQLVDWINSGNHRLLLDLGHVDFIDSSGLGALVSALKSLGNSGDLLLCNVSKPVMSLFNLTRMDRIFQIYPNREEAISLQG